MHFDKNDIHPLQFKAEQSFKDYIINNAKYPKSYEPLQFGNLDSMKISKLEDWELEAEERKVTAKNNVLELLDSIEVKSKFDGYGNYFFRHSYNLKNKQGKRLNRVAFIELDKDLKITNLFNEEDFTSISWIDHFGK